MKKRSIATAFCAALLFCSLLVPVAAQPSDLQTNAQGGAFSSDRRFWFAVPDGQRLRLLVNGNETYRGQGPASSTFSPRAGEDRSFELTAERRSAPPQDELLESRSFIVRIDAVPPAPVKVSGLQGSGAASPWTLLVSAEEGSFARAVVDADSYLTFFEDVQGPLVFAARRVEGLAWSVDAAGNASVPVPFSFKPFSLSVANPSPGIWANRQRLVIASAGAAEIYWSDDGTDPFGPTGKLYGEPVLIEKTGAVVLRVAAKSPDGRVEHRGVAYEVAGADAPALEGLRVAEAKPILFEKTVSVPVGFRWDIGTEGESLSPELAFAGGSNVVLRPVEGLERFVPFFASDGTGMHRFIFGLGAEKIEQPQVPSPPAADLSTPSAPAAYSSGRARVVVWERRQGMVRYRWYEKEDWKDAVGPLSVPAEGGVLEWLVDRGASLDGPYSKTFPAMALEAAFPSSIPSASVRNSSISAGAVDLTPPKEVGGVRFSLAAQQVGLDPRTVELPRGSSVRLDVCDGEQFSWSAAGDGSSLSFRIDRRRPAPPRIFAPEEGGWTHELPEIAFLSDEGRVDAVARWLDEDGSSGQYSLPVSSRLRSFKRGVVEYTIEAKAADLAGNVSDPVLRRFTVDESTVYADGKADGRADGSRAFPFSTLNAALAFARAKGRARIRISGRVPLDGPAELFDGLLVEGGYDANWKRGGTKSDIEFSPGAYLEVKSGSSRLSSLRFIERGARLRPLLSVAGASLEIAGIAVEPSASGKPAAPILAARADARVVAKDCLFLGGSPVVDVVSSRLTMVECLVSGTPGGDSRTVSLRAADSVLRIESSRLETAKSLSVKRPPIAVAVEARGGSLSLFRSVVESSADNSANALAAKGVSLEISETEITSSADGYSSAVTVEGGTANFQKGSLSARARDAAAIILNQAQASSQT